MIGTQIGDYKIVSALGEQSMGMLYVGEHTRLKQKVAIKALDPELTQQEGMKERFEREAQVLARLNHPNIIRLLNFLNLPEGCFIVMELPEGETLEARIERETKVAPLQVAQWMLPILRALSYAHAQGVIHRDLKPANVYITNTTAKILDFGMAKADDTPTLTLQGMTLGTVRYMSREQILGKTLDARSDIYSLGVTMYEAMTGALPFEDENEQKLILKIAKQDPVPLGKRDPSIPAELQKIVHKCLAKERKDRYATADELASALDGWASLAGGGSPLPPLPAVEPTPVKAATPAPPPPPPPAPPPPPPPQPRPRPAFEPPAASPMPAAAPVFAPVAPAAPVAPVSFLNGLVIAGTAFIVLAGGAGVVLIGIGDQLQLAGILALAAGLPIGLVLLLIGLVKAVQAGANRVCPRCQRVLQPTDAFCPYCAIAQQQQAPQPAYTAPPAYSAPPAPAPQPAPVGPPQTATRAAMKASVPAPRSFAPVPPARPTQSRPVAPEPPAAEPEAAPPADAPAETPAAEVPAEAPPADAPPPEEPPPADVPAAEAPAESPPADEPAPADAPAAEAPAAEAPADSPPADEPPPAEASVDAPPSEAPAEAPAADDSASS